MIDYRRITQASPLYRGECDLREMVLLRPIGYDIPRFLREYPGVEDRFTHFVAVMGTPGGERVVGCGLLLPSTDTPGLGKLMQMAVHPQRRGEGIGTRIVIEVERHAFAELGLDAVYCHAQLDACSFYERLGWREDSDIFQEAGIPHRRMRLDRPAPELDRPEPLPEW